MLGSRRVCLLATVIACALAFSGGANASLNLHKVNWREVTIPGWICGMDGPVRLHHGAAYGPSHRWPGQSLIAIGSGWNPVVYGTLGPDGQNRAAALAIDCNNGGGTADGAFAYAQVIFTSVGKSLKVIGVVTPRKQPRRELPTLLTVEIRSGEVVSHEFFYGGIDHTCCPSGRATTVWTYARGKLIAGRTLVTKRPHI